MLRVPLSLMQIENLRLLEAQYPPLKSCMKLLGETGVMYPNTGGGMRNSLFELSRVCEDEAAGKRGTFCNTGQGIPGPGGNSYYRKPLSCTPQYEFE